MIFHKTEIIAEGKTKCLVFKNKSTKKGPSSRGNEPFYNPSMELSRDLSIILNQWFLNHFNKHAKLLDGLGASGIRGIRFANELEGDFNVTINDWNDQAFSLIKKNVEQNNLRNISVTHKNLNILLLENKYHYIDIDPFGSPVPFIESAIRGIHHNGIIACTATDTASLCGVYPKTCFRRYAAKPYHSYLMQEIGLRILLGFICREAAKYNKGIEPIISYSNDYYFRVFVRILNGKHYANKAMENFVTINPKRHLLSLDRVPRDVGPLWFGPLHIKNAIKEIRTILFKKNLHTKHSLWKLLFLFEEEANAPPLFYTTDYIASYYKIPPPKIDYIIQQLNSNGFKIYKTHFSPTAFKTNAPQNEIIKIFIKNNK
jgi:tRNA (guanine26-N2/guanine27-N2)-dimethyltransferase